MSNKFASIINAKKAQEEQPVELAEEVEPTPTPAPPPEPKAKASRKAPPSPTPAAAVPVQVQRRGRPAVGKRSDPSFEQVTAYIRRDTYQAIKIALLQEGDRRDFSDLTEELLGQWLKSRRK